jgi:hypothetical protein
MRFSTGHRPLVAAAALGVALSLVPTAARQAAEKVDYEAVYRIKDEGFTRSKVMEIASFLTDVYGPRLTNSPGYRKAGDWAVKEMSGWGLANVKLEPWGPFGRGWSNERFHATATTAGGSFALFGYPTAWTPGTDGVLKGEAVLAVIDTADDLAKFKGTLKGKFVLIQALRDVTALWEPPARRFTDDQLRDLERETDHQPRVTFGGRGGRGQAQAFADTRMKFLKDEGALGIITPGRGDGGTIFVGGSAANRRPNADLGLPSIVLAVEHYGRIVRNLQKTPPMPVTIELDVRNTFHDETTSFNVIAEIPGTDQASELVMLGAHFDSWHAGTGATDNAAGSAVMMEAMRILKQSGLPLRRTVRLALWGGEEQGLVGSREYVKTHFADRADMVLKPEHARVSGYFNVDNGTGAIRGVYLQGNEAIAPIFDAWMKPFNNLGMRTMTIRDTSGTDHLAFDAVGLPGFQFIQDPVEYQSRTHHSNMDVYERLQEADMKQNAVIVAAFVYHAANREEKLPRKPLPKPQAPPRTTTTASAER